MLFLMVVVLANKADCLTTQTRYHASSKRLSAHFSEPLFSPLKSHFARFVGTLLQFAVPKGVLYHVIVRLKCFPKCISQSKS